MIKDSIKELLFSGSTIEVPYKEKLEDWYGKVCITQLEDKYIVQNPWTTFYDIDEAVDYFCSMAYTSRNIGYVLDRLKKKRLISKYLGDGDFKNPNVKFLSLIEKEKIEVDKESILMNLSEFKERSVERAKEDIKKIVKNYHPDDLVEQLSIYMKEYSTLGPFIGLSFVYKNGDHDFSSSFDWESFTTKGLEDARKEWDGFSHLQMSFHLNGNIEFFTLCI